MKTYDPDQWSRRDHYRWYRNLDFPYLGITAPVDVTELLHARKETGEPLFAGMLHRIMGAVNRVGALRQRIRVEDGQDVVVEHELVHPGFTVSGGEGLFNFAMTDFTADRARFCQAVTEASDEKRDATSLTPFEGQRDDLIFCSCLPWVDFTHVTHPVPLQRVDSIPRIAWGRIVRESSGEDLRAHCAVNIQAHHAVVDGAHVGAFFEHLAKDPKAHQVAG
jgi:chloramphenicol O-acetyltransferase type A